MNKIIDILNILINNQIFDYVDIIKFGFVNSKILKGINWFYAIETLNLNINSNIIEKIKQIQIKSIKYNNDLSDNLSNYNMYYQMSILYKLYKKYINITTSTNKISIDNSTLDKMLLNTIIFEIYPDDKNFDVDKKIKDIKKDQEKIINYGGNLSEINNTTFSFPRKIFSTCAIIPNTVKKIGGITFNSRKLKIVQIPNSVLEIGENAFSENELTCITIPNSVVKLGCCAFRKNYLKSVSIPNSIKKINMDVFAFNLLTSIHIPNSILEIDYCAFACNNLTSVQIPNSVIKICDYAFAYNYLTSVQIPNSVIKICNYAFASNELTSVQIPNSLIKICNYAFVYNEDLTLVQIQD